MTFVSQMQLLWRQYRNQEMDERSMQLCILSVALPSSAGQWSRQARGLLYHKDAMAGQHSRPDTGQ